MMLPAAVGKDPGQSISWAFSLSGYLRRQRDSSFNPISISREYAQGLRHHVIFGGRRRPRMAPDDTFQPLKHC
jgi:hypothetical protein